MISLITFIAVSGHCVENGVSQLGVANDNGVLMTKQSVQAAQIQGQEAFVQRDVCSYSFASEDRWKGGCEWTCWSAHVACQIATGPLGPLVCAPFDATCKSQCQTSVRKKLEVGMEILVCNEGVDDGAHSSSECRQGQNRKATVMEVDQFYWPWDLSTYHVLKYDGEDSNAEPLKLGFWYVDPNGVKTRKEGRSWMCTTDGPNGGRRRAEAEAAPTLLDLTTMTSLHAARLANLAERRQHSL